MLEVINMKPDHWEKYTGREDAKAIIVNIRKHTDTGRPLGQDSFVTQLEKKLSRKLKTLPWGRPKGVVATKKYSLSLFCLSYFVLFSSMPFSPALK